MEDNLKLPASPLPIANNGDCVIDATEYDSKNVGFTKLELASIMIAPALIQSSGVDYFDPYTLARTSVEFAKAVLEEANK